MKLAFWEDSSDIGPTIGHFVPLLKIEVETSAHIQNGLIDALGNYIGSSNTSVQNVSFKIVFLGYVVTPFILANYFEVTQSFLPLF